MTESGSCHKIVQRQDLTMQTAQISPNIRYVSLDDEDGAFGIFIVHLNDYIYHAQEVYSRQEFVRVYRQLQTVYGTPAVA